MATTENAPYTWSEVSSNEFLVFEHSTLSPAPPKSFRIISKAAFGKPLVIFESADEASLSSKMPELLTSINKLISLGLLPAKAIETVKNANLTNTILEMASLAGGSITDKAIGATIYAAATKLPNNCAKFRPMVARYIAEKKIRQSNLETVVKYLSKIATSGATLDESAFVSECGVGISVSKDEITTEINSIITPNKEKLISDRYTFDIMGLFKTLRASNKLKFADNREVKEIFDAAILAILGPKTEADTNAAKSKGKGGKKEENPEAPIVQPKHHDHGLRLPMPDENVQIRPEILAAHLARTGGKMVTRFPPEPNGFLHIGHAKSMFLNFGLAKKYGGVCYLRLDDTNPEKENHVYIESIIDNVSWLGHKPYKVTYASNYFDRLYDCAIDMIKRGKAYVCHQTSEEIKKSRELKQPSPWRDRPIAESLALFELMRQGRFAEGEACLRMKMDITSDNPCMWDLIAYRIKYVPHPMTGNKYCCYPSYDFTHCLNDSFEDIDLSLCTLEFLPRRVSYYWELDALEVYRPVVWEFGRLNITRTVMSKRKLLYLVNKKLVRGWDDPRLPTLNGLRRRGYSPNAINSFCDAVGVTTNTTVFIDYTVLEQHCRQDMEVRCNRAMGVLDPILCEISNFKADQVLDIERPNHPADPTRGKNIVKLGKYFYIDRNDFKLEDKKDFWGLAPGKSVGLRYAGTITCNEVIKAADGTKIEKLVVSFDFEKKIKPQGYLHWVSKIDGPIVAEVRLYEPLFQSERPDEISDWEKDMNPNSEVITTAFIDEVLRNANPGDCFQWERVGFFCCDKDSTREKPVFTRTVSLKESKDKKSL